MFSVEKIVSQHYPSLTQQPAMRKTVLPILRKLLYEQEIGDFSNRYPHLRGLDFAEQVLDHFECGIAIGDRDREHIPHQGKVVFVANHPLGSLDALALIKLISEVRRDVKVLANDVLMSVEPLHSILLPVHNMTGDTPKEKILRIYDHLQKGGALIVFPAGEVSRLKPMGVQDGRWTTGFLRIAGANAAPIVPVFVDARNSALFYGVSMIYKPLATLMLVREMFKQKSKEIRVRVGEPIAPDVYQRVGPVSARGKAQLMRAHLYRIGAGKPGYYPRSVGIALPEPRSELCRAISEVEVLGTADENIDILLYRYRGSCPVMREIGRLREVAFRAVGEGTGKRRDVDRYDEQYLHILLWNRKDLEIVGAYRLADAAQLTQQGGKQALYSATLFDLGSEMKPQLDRGLELGRSFVQPRYWGRRSLHYLWIGIGAFLARYPMYRYLFGPVSMSASMPEPARELMVAFYRHYFGCEGLATHKHSLPESASHEVAEKVALWSSLPYRDALRVFRAQLDDFGTVIPTLYRQYSELCEPGGVKFLDFGVDVDFGNCVDGLVLIDIEKMSADKRARYIDCHLRRDDSTAA